MNKIIVLPEEVRNKIAAGEVVERPASIVKELLENSVDAQADYIDIEIEDAGKKLIRITDNGDGMTADDAVLSIKRYATSKIKTFDDLDNLATLGFRGEALSSISSVSRLSISTKTKDSETAWKITSEGGKILSKKECAHPQGTTVEVKDLFFNIPARRKFLKSNITEQSHIIRAIEDISLCHYNTGFSVKINSKNTLTAPPSNNLDGRIADILGSDVYDNLIAVNLKNGYIQVTGFVSGISKNSFSTTNNLQYFFVNQHPVYNRLISQALNEAFHDSLPVGRYPVAILLIEVSPQYVDINVHPAKRLVKFSEDRQVYEIILNAVRNSLTKQESPFISIPEPKNSIRETNYSYNEPRPEQNTLSFNTAANAPQTGYSINEDREPFDKHSISFLDEYRILGQLHDTYIILGTEEGLVVVDQHAANERVLYEIFSAADSKNKHNIQNLLVPVTMEFAPHEIEILKEHLAEINEFGFEVSGFGKNTLILKAMPASLTRVKRLKDFFAEFIKILADGFKEQKLTSIESREKIIRASCRAAVKASDRLSIDEIKELLSGLKKCSQPLCCPHGRPTILKITARELQKKFQRI